ncbi:MAG: type II toxin-antitoxin system RelE/ParE family toxin [Desulfobacteraceae bacterium]|nr:type II toxin-antitoxin system RelE/ParE family toxin [Desulfobacteraceae bacterium]
MKIKILKAAKNDLREGYYFYESQQTGLGAYFLETLSSDIESLKLFAGIHSIHFEKYYRLLSKRFPFAVYYQLSKNEVRVYAVVDCRRSPAWIRNKFD